MNNTFKQALLNDLKQARQEPGYVAMTLFASKDVPDTLLLLEQWQNQAAFDRHLAQPHTTAVLELTETALISPMEIQPLENLSMLFGVE